MKHLKQIAAVTVGVVIWVMLTGWSFAEESLRITKDELVKMMEDENLIILDVRQDRDWESSSYKIKGAVREEPERFSKWYGNYAKDRPIVLYCS